LLSNITARQHIAAGVELERYLRPEEEIAYLGPSPARSLLQAIDSITLAELGSFFNRHYRRPERREFDVRGALEEYTNRRTQLETLESATDAEYRELTASLGDEWREITGTDGLNRHWDRLGNGVCDVLVLHPDLLPFFPADLKERLVYLAQLGNSFARKCGEILGLKYLTVTSPMYKSA